MSLMHRRGAWAALLLLSCASAHAVAPNLSVGTLKLRYCNSEYGGYCGSIERPLDPTGQQAGSVHIAFEWYPHTDTSTAPAGAILAEEGGPGYSTTGSRDGYVRMLSPLRDHRDILLVDKRGTGRSDAIDCLALQHSRATGARAITACAKQLGAKAWLYGTALAADDVAAVIEALGLGAVDYYGDSYGTYFGQVFAVRHPDLLRTLVLDSAYPVLGETPWFASEIETGPASLDVVCSRSPSCAALGGSSLARFNALLAALRDKPLSGTAPGATGEPQSVTADAGGLFLIFYNAGNSPSAYRDLDAAARAYLDAQDGLPLLRLVAEAQDGNLLGGPAYQFSVGLYDAVLCSDYAQLFDLNAEPRAREAQFAQSIAAQQKNAPDIYAPFTLQDALTAPTDPESLNTCLNWPQPPAWIVPGQPVAADAKFPNVPTLVLNGEIDTVTSPSEGAAVAALFPNSRYLLVPNAIHETAIGDAGVWVPPNGADFAECVAPIALAFIRSGGELGDSSCLAQIRPIRTVPTFAVRYTDVAPALALAGNAVDEDGLRLAAATAETVGDVIARYYVSTSGKSVGLRGGKWFLRATSTGYDLHLSDVRWTQDLGVSGLIQWNQLSGDIHASIKLSGGAHRGAMNIAWNDRATNAQATLSGLIDGRKLEASRVAP